MALEKRRYHCYGEPDDDDRRDTSSSSEDEHPTLEEVLVGLTLINSD